MVTQKGDNTYVVAIEGNFDQAQSAVKAIFGDKELQKKWMKRDFSSHQLTQLTLDVLFHRWHIMYMLTQKLFAEGKVSKDQKINVVVPTGNFGNILAAYYAKNMGLPIDKLICASNENRVLYDFFTTGEYDKNREFILTNSPSMDILISSNLERLIYRIAGDDAGANKKMMEELSKDGKYSITPEMKAKLADFYANYASEEETAAIIKKIYEETGYVMDTHTAVAASVYEKYKNETKDDNVTVIASTASPFKFTRSVMNAIDPKYDSMGDFELVDELSKIGNVKVPNAIEEIRNAEIRHNNLCEVAGMKDIVKKFLGM